MRIWGLYLRGVVRESVGKIDEELTAGLRVMYDDAEASLSEVRETSCC